MEPQEAAKSSVTSTEPANSTTDGLPDESEIVRVRVFKKNIRWLLVLVAIGICLFLLLPRFTEIERTLVIVSRLKGLFVLLALIAQVLSYAGSAYLLRTVVKLTVKPLSILDGILITLGSNAVGTLGGGVVGTATTTYYWLRRRGVDVAGAGLASSLPIALNNTVLAGVSLVGLIFLLLHRKSSPVLVAGLGFSILLTTAAAGIFAWGLTHREKLNQLVAAISRWISRIRHRPQAGPAPNIDRVLQTWDSLVQGGWRGPLIGAALNTGFDMLTLAFFFRAAGHPVSPAVLVAGYGLPQLLGKLTVVLGGIGVVETSMIGLYVALGVPGHIAVVAVSGTGFFLCGYRPYWVLQPFPISRERRAEFRLPILRDFRHFLPDCWAISLTRLVSIGLQPPGFALQPRPTGSTATVLLWFGKCSSLFSKSGFSKAVQDIMFEIRIHGRGGQGVVTAAELLSIAAFHEGKRSQAFPTFGSERMGAPVTAFCRISDKPIRSREPVAHPDALIIQDATLLRQIPVFEGLPDSGFVLINSTQTFEELGLEDLSRKLPAEHCATVPATQLALEHVGRPLPNAALLGAFAAMTGEVKIEHIEAAIKERFRGLIGEANAAAARAAYGLMLKQAEVTHA